MFIEIIINNISFIHLNIFFLGFEDLNQMELKYIIQLYEVHEIFILLNPFLN